MLNLGQCLSKKPAEKGATLGNLPPLILAVWIKRLPQFDFVAVGIVYPGEAAVAFVLAIRINVDAFFRQAVEQCIEVIDDVVHMVQGLTPAAGSPSRSEFAIVLPMRGLWASAD